MKYTDIKIQTQREFPNNMRTQGFGWLVRAGFLTRENELTELGKIAVKHLEEYSNDASFRSISDTLPILKSERALFFPLSTGNLQVAHCPSCKYTELLVTAKFKKTPLPFEEERPLEKVSTPDCNTIESLANFLNIPKEKTAKALMYTRNEDGKFIFVVIRGDMQVSEAKLQDILGETKPAEIESVIKSGAEAGYASPINLKDALIVVDDLIPKSPNLVAGANEVGFHFINTNCGRDYTPKIAADLVLAKAGDACVNCGSDLAVLNTIQLVAHTEFNYENILVALAETYHDEKGLKFPQTASPFDVYLMHIGGKTLDTKAKAEEIYNQLKEMGMSVLFDDRDERAGVKFNDADLIGCPIRITVGEKALQNGMIELKKRNSANVELLELENLKNISQIS